MIVQDPAAPPPEPDDLPAVVVTGARLPPAAGEAAFSVIRLDTEAVQARGRLDESLAAVPAVTLFRRTSSLGSNPTTQGLSLRAVAPSGAGRALVTLDGVPLNDPFGGWVIWGQAPSEALSGADILRGAGTGPYGAGALTGTVQLRERDEGVDLDLSGAERGGLRAAGAGSVDWGPVKVTAAGLYEASDGYVPVRGAAAGTADTPLDLEARAASVRLDLPLGAARLSLRAAAFEEARGSGLAGAEAVASGNVLSATAARPPSGDGYGWRLQGWRRESDLFNSSVAVAADRSTTTPAGVQDETPSVGWGVNAALRRAGPAAGGRLEWELGADVREAEGETRERFRFMGGAFTRDRVAGGETGTAGVYGEGSWTDGPWLVAGGLRLDRWSNGEGRRLERDLATGLPTLDERDPDRSGEVLNGRLAVRRELGGGQAVRAAAYSAFRPATLNELHRPFRVGNDLTEANAALEPERLTGVEAGWAWESDRGAVSATVFVNRLEDAVVNVTIGVGPGTFPRAGFVPAGGVLRQRANAGTIEAVGLELDGRWSVTDRLSLRAAAAVTDAEVDGGTAAPQLTGLRPAQAPVFSVTAGVEARPTERLTLAADLRWEGRRFDDDLNSRVLDAAATLDLAAEWRLTSEAVVRVRVDNLFDEEVEVSETATGVAGYGPPRTVSVGLRFSR